MAETFTNKLKLSKRDTGDLNWGQGANANLDVIDAYMQQAALRPPRSVTVTLGSGAVGPNLTGNTTYFYKVTAVTSSGETTEGIIPTVVEGQVVQPGSPLPVIIQWEMVKGASGYKIYKATTSNQEKYLASITGEATTSFTDNGNTAFDPAIPIPALNTASLLGANEQIAFNDAGALTGNEKLKFSKDTGILALNGQIKIVDSQQAAGKVLTSDATGLGSWQAPTAGNSSSWTVVEKTTMTGETYTFSGLTAGVREYKLIIDTYLNNQTNINIFLNDGSSYNLAKKTSVSLIPNDTAYTFGTTFNALISVSNPAHIESLMVFTYNSAQLAFDVNMHSTITEKGVFGKTANDYVFYRTSASAATEVSSIQINAYAGTKVILLKLAA